MDNANRATSVLNYSKEEVNVVNVVNVGEHAMAQAHPTRPRSYLIMG
jgi:hypothetical protein